MSRFPLGGGKKTETVGRVADTGAEGS
jgi:hypothetical protein